MLSIPLASISLHKAHELPNSEPHGNVRGGGGKLHFTLHLDDQHHAQIRFQLLQPSPDDRAVCEHGELEGRRQAPQEPFGLGTGGGTDAHQQMLRVSPGNVIRVVQSGGFDITCRISFCNIAVLCPVSCRGGNKTPNTALRLQAKCSLEATHKHACVSVCVCNSTAPLSTPIYSAGNLLMFKWRGRSRIDCGKANSNFAAQLWNTANSQTAQLKKKNKSYPLI